MSGGNNSNPYNPFLDKLKTSGPGQRPPSLDELEPVVCPKCGNSIFDRYFKMYRLSALKTANGKEQVFNVPAYVCASCAEIIDLDKNKAAHDEAREKTEPVTEEKAVPVTEEKADK